MRVFAVVLSGDEAQEVSSVYASKDAAEKALARLKRVLDRGQSPWYQWVSIQEFGVRGMKQRHKLQPTGDAHRHTLVSERLKLRAE